MQTSAKGLTTIDDVFLWIDVSIIHEVVRRLSSWSDESDAICALLGVKILQCAGRIETPPSHPDNTILVQLNTRACKHSDLQIYQVPPLEKRIFIATVMNTARLSVKRVTPCNAQKLSAMGL
jgi:hypothetical protein